MAVAGADDHLQKPVKSSSCEMNGHGTPPSAELLSPFDAGLALPQLAHKSAPISPAAPPSRDAAGSPDPRPSLRALPANESIRWRPKYRMVRTILIMKVPCNSA